VLDLTSSVAGPYATMMLADLGAEVIKVERPRSGDDSRQWGPPFLDGESLWFLSVNRNKASVTLRYDTPRGRDILHGLVGKSDAVVLNLVTKVQKKLGVDYETLRRVKPDLVFAAITGFGLEGARADLPCYDLIAEGYSGVMDLTGEPDNPPQKVGTPAADMLAGMDAAFATVAALLDRQRTGRGHLIDVSLVGSMTRFMTPRLVPYMGSGELMRRSGGRDSVIAVYQTFDTADEPITLGLGNDAIWARFWQAVGKPDVANEARFATNAKRREARSEIVQRIQKIMRTRGRDEWLKLFRENRIPAGPINRADEVTGDLELQAQGLFYAVDGGLAAPVPQVGTGFHIDGESGGCRAAPPVLGQHTDDVLRNLLAMTAGEIAKLREDGIV